MIAPWNSLINSRQFSVNAWPTNYNYPNVVFDTTYTLEAGQTRLALTHAYEARTRASDALMTRGIFSATARAAAAKAGRGPEPAPGPPQVRGG